MGPSLLPFGVIVRCTTRRRADCPFPCVSSCTRSLEGSSAPGDCAELFL